jgi:hypothetical protein
VRTEKVIRPSSDILTIPLSNTHENLDEILICEDSEDNQIESSETEKSMQSNDFLFYVI